MKKMKKTKAQAMKSEAGFRPGAHNLRRFGPLFFLVGFGIVIVASLLWPLDSSLTVMLSAIGVVVGLSNIEDKEVSGFLLATVAFMLSAIALKQMDTATIFNGMNIFNVVFPRIIDNMIAFIAPAGIIVAFKEIIILAKD
ncbi:hypothetical protein KJ780_04110 [Candidatus Micrarchaeota archaeon]|nr:hypothetical protein [Candidatus Micrarchaeota archaeon]